VPAVAFDSELNSCGQPRIGLGYAVTYLLGIFRQLDLLVIDDAEVQAAITHLRSVNSVYANPEAANPAFKLASETKGKSTLFMASEHLTGNAHIMANQWNENAKNMAAWFAIPELNHHLLEGFVHPRKYRSGFVAVLIQSYLYDPRNRRRHEITRTLLEDQDVACSIVASRAVKILEEAYDLLLLGSYASFYQAMINDTDPSPIPQVDRFKTLMAT